MTDPAAAVLAVLQSRGETLATAESLTGGLIGGLLTGVPGASAVYVGGAITYATRLKASLAGVDDLTLERYGPVAALTAEQLAVGIARRCAADWGLSATGVAGPDPQDGHPVGQVFIAVARPADDVVQVRELSLQGDRMQIRQAAAAGAIELLSDTLGMKYARPGVQ